MNDTHAIRLVELHKSFGRRKRRVRAIRGIDLTITPGQVYGFLGPNGAGKSTTIRMIMDLVRPTAGHVEVYGRNVSRHHDVLQRVGALVEGAAFYPYLSGRKNLEVLARTGGHYDAARVDGLLAQVNLADRADQPVKGYSTGMKQRLGLAAALLNDPDLVILDEPTNGLDPAGIEEMRTFIRRLVDEQGKTVFLSSHLLSEVEQVCDRVAIIHNGKILREGPVAELLAAQTELYVEVGQPEQATAVLSPQYSVMANGKGLAVQAGRGQVPHIVRQLVAQDLDIFRVEIKRQSLEAYFLQVTREAGDG